jgi:hypothetical protein
VQAFGNEIFKEQELTIGVGLGDRWSFYCVLDEAVLTKNTIGQTIAEVSRVPYRHVQINL